MVQVHVAGPSSSFMSWSEVIGVRIVNPAPAMGHGGNVESVKPKLPYHGVS